MASQDGERPHNDAAMEELAQEGFVHPESDECTTSAGKLLEHVLDVSENLGFCDLLPPIFDGCLFERMVDAFQRAPRRLKDALDLLLRITGNVVDYAEYVQWKVTKTVQNVTFFEITNDGALIESIVGRHFLYEGDKNLNDTCEIIGQGKNVTDLYNINIVKCIQNFVMNLTTGIQDIQEQFMYIANNVSDPSLWSHNSPMNVTENRIHRIVTLANDTQNFIIDMDPHVDTALEHFKINITQVAQQTQKSFGDVVTDLATLQASQEAKSPGAEKKRPNIANTTMINETMAIEG